MVGASVVAATAAVDPPVGSMVGASVVAATAARVTAAAAGGAVMYDLTVVVATL
jgi:hypothetical protein